MALYTSLMVHPEALIYCQTTAVTCPPSENPAHVFRLAPKPQFGLCCSAITCETGYVGTWELTSDFFSEWTSPILVALNHNLNFSPASPQCLGSSATLKA